MSKDMKLSRRRVKLDNDRYCFSAGDLRCNEQLELTVLHTVEWICNCTFVVDHIQRSKLHYKDIQGVDEGAQ